MFRRAKFFIPVLAAVFFVFFAHGFILDGAGRFIYKKDELAPADVIVVLAGEVTERVEYGVQLFRRGLSKKDRIILTGGPLVWKYTWASLMKDQTVDLGVPEKFILLQDKSTSTEEDAMYTKQILQAHGYRSIILVTSPYHSKRSSIIFERVMGDKIRIINAPVENSWFRFDNWWKRRRDRGVVLSEYSKFLWLLLFGVHAP